MSGFPAYRFPIPNSRFLFSVLRFPIPGQNY